MSASWNGRGMWSGRGSSILDAADAALARCGAARTGSGLTPERVRILMSRERLKMVSVKAEPRREVAPAPAAAPEPVRGKREALAARNARIVAGWLAMPESGRALKKYATAVRLDQRSVRAVLEAAGVVIRDARQVRIAERLQRLQQLDCGGRSIAELAGELGVDRATVRALKQRASLQVNPRTGKRRGADVVADKVPWTARPRGQRALDWARPGAGEAAA